MFSVVIPNYNHARFLKKRLDTVLGQTFRNFEVIILDDHSTDESAEIINSYNDIRITHKIFNSENSGSPFKQWKKGLELAKYEYVWVAESDDWCEPNFLEEAAKHLSELPTISVYYCDSNLVGENEEPFHNNLQIYTKDLHKTLWDSDHYMEGERYVKQYFKTKNIILNASSAIFRKSAAIKHIDKILDFKTSGDWLFWLLLLKEGDIYFSAKKQNYFRHLSQSTRNYDTLEKRERRIIEKIKVNSLLFDHFVFEPAQKKEKRKSLIEEWIKYHTAKEGLKKSFFSITEIPFLKINKPELFYRFIINKTLKRWIN